ncbi:MAG TPA: class I SAM-dependent methyltransferase family protein [Candidatus Thermoplasmatota archaeon]|nr:class I SAM-dependent methyltransferase family protein [Candidatus Thermoplasmatota archaeon]
MVLAPAVRVPKREAQATRERLQELGVLRHDLEVAREGDDVLFPVAPACGPTLPTVDWDFVPRERRPSDYRELLQGWSAEELDAAPRAFDQVGDIVVVKVPDSLEARAQELGEAIRQFHANCRAVFHDRGVEGVFRVRGLQRIAGSGGSATVVGENGFRFHVDPAAAYFSPRLGGERARVAALVRPGEHVVDLFGGVGALAVQAAARGATVDTVDLNPIACELARRNVELNRTRGVGVHCGDARQVARDLAKADRIVMNLPHGAFAFLDVAAALAAPSAVLHHHEILPSADVASREAQVLARLRELGRQAEVLQRRVVRRYSAQDDHVVWDLRLP